MIDCILTFFWNVFQRFADKSEWLLGLGGLVVATYSVMIAKKTQKRQEKLDILMFELSQINQREQDKKNKEKQILKHPPHFYKHPSRERIEQKIRKDFWDSFVL